MLAEAATLLSSAERLYGDKENGVARLLRAVRKTSDLEQMGK